MIKSVQSNVKSNQKESIQKLSRVIVTLHK